MLTLPMPSLAVQYRRDNPTLLRDMLTAWSNGAENSVSNYANMYLVQSLPYLLHCAERLAAKTRNAF